MNNLVIKIRYRFCRHNYKGQNYFKNHNYLYFSSYTTALQQCLYRTRCVLVHESRPNQILRAHVFRRHWNVSSDRAVPDERAPFPGTGRSEISRAGFIAAGGLGLWHWIKACRTAGGRPIRGLWARTSTPYPTQAAARSRRKCVNMTTDMWMFPVVQCSSGHVCWRHTVAVRCNWIWEV